MGGPIIGWSSGRIDQDETAVTPDGRLPNADSGPPLSDPSDAAHLRAIFNRMGFNDQEIVALSGAHALGRCHENASGYSGPWTFTPTTFNNAYFTLLTNLKWIPKDWTGPPQYVDAGTGRLMMLPTDLVLLQDKSFMKWVRIDLLGGPEQNRPAGERTLSHDQSHNLLSPPLSSFLRTGGRLRQGRKEIPPGFRQGLSDVGGMYAETFCVGFRFLCFSTSAVQCTLDPPSRFSEHLLTLTAALFVLRRVSLSHQPVIVLFPPSRIRRRTERVDSLPRNGRKEKHSSVMHDVRSNRICNIPLSRFRNFASIRPRPKFSS